MAPVPLILLLCVFAEPATQPVRPSGDDTLDWLMGQAAPATKPADLDDELPTTGPSPFAQAENPEAAAGKVALSDGRVLIGQIATTRGKPIRIFDEQAKQFRDVPLALIRRVEARVDWERDEREWQFERSGSDVKVYTGRTYPARLTSYMITLATGQQITGGVVAPIYVRTADGQPTRFALYKRNKGPIGQALKDLVYIQRIDIEEAK
jgi:hypothetical protein